jgi:hypothetical protein
MLIESAAVAHGHDILLLWINIARLRIPSFLFVSSAVDSAFEVLTFMDSIACDIVGC